MKSIVELEKKITEQLKAKKVKEAEKTPEELEKEILENREAMEAIEAKAAKEKAAKEQEAKAAKDEDDEIQTTKPMEEHSVEPVKNPNEICSFCGEEFTAQGIGRHVAAKHKAPGITLEDINRMNQGEITPPELLDEKGITTIYGLSPEVEKKEFSDWFDVEENPEDTEENPEEKKLEDPGKEARGNGAAGVLPLLFLIGIPAAMILSRIPKFKEFGDKLLATLGDLGSKESPGSSGPLKIKESFGAHAVRINKERGG